MKTNLIKNAPAKKKKKPVKSFNKHEDTFSLHTS